MGPLGLLGLNISEKWDGTGSDHVSAAILIEELGRGNGSTALIVAAHLGLSSATIADFGSNDSEEKHPKPLARGEMLGALSLTEPGAGSDLQSGVRTIAVKGAASGRLMVARCG